jgi:hypothetical protein
MQPTEIEVRVPTYMRPVLLKRALESLLASDFPFWNAIILDDCPSQSAKEVALSFRDQRIVYRANGRRLGGAANIDLAFTPSPFVGGEFATILEDDNWFHESHLGIAVKAMRRRRVDVLHASTEIWQETEGGFRNLHHHPFTVWWGDRERLVDPLEVAARALLTYAVSNAALVWRLSDGVNLQVGPGCTDQWIQESLRGLLIEEPFLFLPVPTVCVSWPLSPPNRAGGGRLLNARLQALYMAVANRFGDGVFEEAAMLALRHARADALNHAIIRSLRVGRFTQIDWTRQNLILLGKSIALRVMSLLEPKYRQAHLWKPGRSGRGWFPSHNP